MAESTPQTETRPVAFWGSSDDLIEIEGAVTGCDEYNDTTIDAHEDCDGRDCGCACHGPVQVDDDRPEGPFESDEEVAEVQRWRKSPTRWMEVYGAAAGDDPAGLDAKRSEGLDGRPGYLTDVIQGAIEVSSHRASRPLARSIVRALQHAGLASPSGVPDGGGTAAILRKIAATMEYVVGQNATAGESYLAGWAAQLRAEAGRLAVSAGLPAEPGADHVD